MKILKDDTTTIDINGTKLNKTTLVRDEGDIVTIEITIDGTNKTFSLCVLGVYEKSGGNIKFDHYETFYVSVVEDEETSALWEECMLACGYTKEQDVFLTNHIFPFPNTIPYKQFEKIELN